MYWMCPRQSQPSSRLGGGKAGTGGRWRSHQQRGEGVELAGMPVFDSDDYRVSFSESRRSMSTTPAQQVLYLIIIFDFKTETTTCRGTHVELDSSTQPVHGVPQTRSGIVADATFSRTPAEARLPSRPTPRLPLRTCWRTSRSRSRRRRRRTCGSTACCAAAEEEVGPSKGGKANAKERQEPRLSTSGSR